MGDFIKSKREGLGISQKSLGLAFNPPVTTQFISNLERGVTPLPHLHVSVLAKALQVPDSEIASLLEKEYALKLSVKLGHATSADGVPHSVQGGTSQSVMVKSQDAAFIKALCIAYEAADAQKREAFLAACANILGKLNI